MYFNQIGILTFHEMPTTFVNKTIVSSTCFLIFTGHPYYNITLYLIYTFGRIVNSIKNDESDFELDN